MNDKHTFSPCHKRIPSIGPILRYLLYHLRIVDRFRVIGVPLLFEYAYMHGAIRILYA